MQNLSSKWKEKTSDTQQLSHLKNIHVHQLVLQDSGIKHWIKMSFFKIFVQYTIDFVIQFSFIGVGFYSGCLQVSRGRYFGISLGGEIKDINGAPSLERLLILKPTHDFM